jgi:dethiobiotin synthase
VRALFVAGTQTDVGKTFVAAALLRALRRAGLEVSYFKPVLTGGEPGDGASDPDVVTRAAGWTAHPRTLAWAWFAEPASPHFAARLEGRAIDPEALVAETCRRAERSPRLVIEGCGGLAVPLSDDGFLLSDLAAALGAPVALVASARLGAIHEALLALEHARAKGLDLAGVVWNRVGGTARELDTMETVERLGSVRRLAAVPSVEGPDALDRALDPAAARRLWCAATGDPVA